MTENWIRKYFLISHKKNLWEKEFRNYERYKVPCKKIIGLKYDECKIYKAISQFSNLYVQNNPFCLIFYRIQSY